MLENALVKEWMSAPVVMAKPDLPLSKAHKMMKDHNVRRLPVVDDGKLLGIITIGDVREASPSDVTTLSIWELNYLWAQLTVAKVMTRKVRTVKPDDSMIDVAELMLKHKISGLPVLDEAGQAVGMITESDVFRMLVTSRATALATVRQP